MKHKSERSAGGIVYKPAGDEMMWLITQHSEHKGWGFPKGLIADINESESIEEAALREVKEEGGVVAVIRNTTPVETAYTYNYADTLIDKKVQYFLMEYESGDPKDHDWEVSEAKFVTEDEVMKTLTYTADKDAFMKILNIM